MDDQNSNTTIPIRDIADSPSSIDGSASLLKKQNSTEYQTAPWVVILLILIFQPVAWYFMYREKRYHRWFSFLLWFNSGNILLLYCILVFIALPQLESFYQNLGVPHAYTNFYLSSALPIILSIAGLIIGIMLFNKTKKQNNTYKKILKIAVGLLILNSLSFGIAIGYSILDIITPIYNVIGSV